MKGDGNPFLGVPEGSVRVENPDGVYRGSPDDHSLYDAKSLPQPTIPGDFDNTRDIGGRRGT